MTRVPIAKSQNPIDYGSKIVLLGSCFAINITEKFRWFKFENYANPFGILFHPLAIEELVRRAIRKEYYSEQDIFFHNERWHCFDAHSDLSAETDAQLLQNLNQNLEHFRLQMTAASHVFITYGTSWVYRDQASQKIVANCHKVPQAQFDKVLLSATQIRDAIQNTISLIQSINAMVSITFTVSPVRHLKDGFVENQQSKANLIIGIHQAVNNLPNTENRQLLDYFPSYEIMMDELRDYRFYDRDMIHPSAVAVDYIWERLCEAYLTTNSMKVMKEIGDIRKALAHRPFNPDSESYRTFMSKINQRIEQIRKEYPLLHF